MIDALLVLFVMVGIPLVLLAALAGTTICGICLFKRIFK